MFQKSEADEFCSRVSDIEALRDDEMAPGESEALHQHLKTCGACQEEWRALDSLNRALIEMLPESSTEAYNAESRKEELLDRCRRSLSTPDSPTRSERLRGSRIRLLFKSRSASPINEASPLVSPSLRRAAAGLAMATALGAMAGFWVTRKPTSDDSVKTTANPSPSQNVWKDLNPSIDGGIRESRQIIWVQNQSETATVGPLHARLTNGRVYKIREIAPTPEEYARELKRSTHLSPATLQLENALSFAISMKRLKANDALKDGDHKNREASELDETIQTLTQKLTKSVQADRINDPPKPPTPAEVESARRLLEKMGANHDRYEFCAAVNVSPSGIEPLEIEEPTLSLQPPAKPMRYVNGSIFEKLPSRGSSFGACIDATPSIINEGVIRPYAIVPTMKSFQPISARLEIMKPNEGKSMTSGGSAPIGEGQRSWRLSIRDDTPNATKALKKAHGMSRFCTLIYEEELGPSTYNKYPMIQITPPWRLIRIDEANRSRPGWQVTSYYLGLPNGSLRTDQKVVSMRYMSAYMLEHNLKQNLLEFPEMMLSRPKSGANRKPSL